ncbi:MAG: hypothetical protein GYB68_03090 [Chloroflexi bacterium]|nr:hypothetical protein [Chloroflexota bacterium]
MTEGIELRHDIEDRIAGKAAAVPIEHADWQLTREYREFVESWDELIDYYIESEEDSDVSMAVVSSYMEIAGALRNLWAQRGMPYDLGDLLAELDQIMLDLGREASSNR